jgi:hypothetical protein
MLSLSMLSLSTLTFNSLTMLLEYARLAYIRRLRGRNTVDKMVEIAVIVTEREREALNMEHHQLE